MTDRLYRGLCTDKKVLDETLHEFDDKRKSIYALLDMPGLLDNGEKRITARYFDRFYADIDDAARVQHKLVSRMRGCR